MSKEAAPVNIEPTNLKDLQYFCRIAFDKFIERGDDRWAKRALNYDRLLEVWIQEIEEE
jgi:hypothetical protein